MPNKDSDWKNFFELAKRAVAESGRAFRALYTYKTNLQTQRAMRVAFLLQSFPAISETFILNQITGLIERGNHVDIYSFGRGDCSVLHSDVTRHDLLNRTTYIQPAPITRIERALGLFGLASKAYKGKKRELLRTINVMRYGRKAASLRLSYWAPAFLGKDYDVIHCHYGYIGVAGLPLRDLCVPRAKLAVVFHGSDMSTYLRNGNAKNYQSLFRHADCLLPISNRWRKSLLNLGASASNTFVHHMGIDCQKFRFVARKCDGTGPLRLLSVARLVEKKGIGYAIRAVAKVFRQHHNLEYNIIGDGPLRGELINLIAELDMTKRIHLLGTMPQEEVKKMLYRSHLFLCPSVTAESGDEEGIPVALMEAIASGLPVVSTLHSGIPELVTDKTSGLLVPERNVGALAGAILQLLAQPEVWADMGQAGRSHVESEFDINRLNDRLLGIFGELKDGHAGREALPLAN